MAGERTYAAFFALLKRLEGATKEALVWEFTAGRTDSLREMTDAEYRAMLASMRDLVDDRAALRHARSRALHHMQALGIDTLSWDAVNAFCAQSRISGKPFGRLSPAELHALVRKLRAIGSKDARREQAAGARAALTRYEEAIRSGKVTPRNEA